MTANYLYNKKHVVIISSSKEERKIVLRIQIETRKCITKTKDLFIRLTDPDSLTFLCCLINEDYFRELKQRQRLLMDSSKFGEGIIDLLELSHADEDSKYPKYIMHLCGSGDLAQATLSDCNWTLNFFETNPVKHLIYLSLRFDTDQYNSYLVECVHGCRSEMATLTSKLTSTEKTLSKKLQDTELALATVTDELQQQRISSRSQLDELQARLKHLETVNNYHTKQNANRVDWEIKISIKMHNLEEKIKNLEQMNKCLDLKNSKLKNDNLDLKSNIGNVEIASLNRGEKLCEKTIFNLQSQLQKMSSTESKPVLIFGQSAPAKTEVKPSVFNQVVPITGAVTSKPTTLFSGFGFPSGPVSSTGLTSSSSATLFTSGAKPVFAGQPLVAPAVSTTSSVAAPGLFQFGVTVPVAPTKSESTAGTSLPLKNFTDFQFGTTTGGPTNGWISSPSTGSVGTGNTRTGGQVMARRTLKVLRKR